MRIAAIQCMRNTSWLVSLIFGASAALPVAAQAQPTATPTPRASSSRVQPDPEQRKAMATLHRDMANCLDSSRPFDECRQEMRQNMKNLKGKGYCPGCGGDMGMHREDSNND